MPTFDPQAFTEESRRNWDSVAPHYERLSAGLFAPITSAFAEFCAAKPGERVLDLACGPGTLTASLAKAAGAGNVLGTDLSEGMLERARLAAPGAEFKPMNAEALDLPDASFDLVTCQLGLMLFARPEAALAEAARVLKPGGRAAYLVQGRREGMRFTAVLMGAIARRAPELKTPGAPVLFAFGPDGALKAALEKAGLARVEDKRLSGTLPFASKQAYWDEMMRSAGRTGALLRGLDAGTQALVKEDVWRELEEFAAAGGALAVPYEVMMARGFK